MGRQCNLSAFQVRARRQSPWGSITLHCASFPVMKWLVMDIRDCVWENGPFRTFRNMYKHHLNKPILLWAYFLQYDYSRRGRVHGIVNCMEFFGTLQCYEGMQIENRGISRLLVWVWVGTKLVQSWHSHCTNNYFINIISSGDMNLIKINKQQKLKLLEKWFFLF